MHTQSSSLQNSQPTRIPRDAKASNGKARKLKAKIFKVIQPVRILALSPSERASACMGSRIYCRGLNNYQYHVEVHLRYLRP